MHCHKNQDNINLSDVKPVTHISKLAFKLVLNHHVFLTIWWMMNLNIYATGKSFNLPYGCLEPIYFWSYLIMIIYPHFRAQCITPSRILVPCHVYQSILFMACCTWVWSSLKIFMSDFHLVLPCHHSSSVLSGGYREFEVDVYVNTVWF